MKDERYVVLLFYIGFGYCGWQRQTADSQPKTEHSFIQECLEDSAKLAVPQSVGVSACASGRTDAGTPSFISLYLYIHFTYLCSFSSSFLLVLFTKINNFSGTHASGQIAHIIFRYPKPSPLLAERAQWTHAQWTQHCAQLAQELNRNLPHDIRVQHLFSFPIHFPPQLNYFHARKSAQWKQYSYYIQQGGVYMVDWAPFCFFFKEKFGILVLAASLLLRSLLSLRFFVPSSPSSSMYPSLTLLSNPCPPNQL